MIDFIAYIIVRLLNKILSFVPISVSLWIGRRLGSLAFFFNKKRRLVAYANLKAAFAKEKSPEELKGITKRVYQNMAQTFAEVLNLTKVSRKYVDKYVEVVNMERIRNAAKSGRGTILLTGHFGDWELSSLVSSVEGFPILVLAREQKMKRLNELLNRLRESNGCKVIRKGMSTKNILRALYDKNIVGILSDQDAGRNGMFVNLFGRPTSSHSGPMEIAKHTGSLILPNFIVRTGGPHHKLYLEEYIDFNDLKSEDDVKEALQRFTSLLESYIRKYPDQWLWLHKRWKSTPTRTVLVLNDGRAGHLNQSIAVASAIQKARMTQGYRSDDTKIIVVDVKFKDNFKKTLLSLCATFAGWRCHGCMRCMRACLEEKTYDTLMKTYAEFVVSCGSGLAPVNVFMSKENNAKNLVVMRPNIFAGLRQFSLAIVPRHDRPSRRKNVVETITAPNLINEDALNISREELKKRIGGETGDAVGVLIGGDNPEFLLNKETAVAAADAVALFSEKHNAQFLVTTSRRTSNEVEAELKNRLNNNSRCRLLIIANEENPPETVSGILALSKVVVVSGDSVSMVSEAISAGRRVIVFELEKKRSGTTKHERALKILEKNGYVTVCKAQDLANCLEKAWGDTRPVRKLDDSAKILSAIRRLI